MKKMIFGFCVLFMSTGCASFLAIQSTNVNPEIMGSITKEDLKAQGVRPERCIVKDNGQTKCWYKIKINDDQSIGRAGLHIIADILTGGFWEIPAIVYELGKGDEYLTEITFDQNGCIIKAE